MKQLLIKIKNNKLLFILATLTVISLILGLLFPAILSQENTELIKKSVTSFFTAIKTNQLNYPSALISSLSNNLICSLGIWLLGISIIGLPIILICIIFKGFLIGFSFTSILITYGIKGVLYAIIYTLPNIINLLGLFLLSYYAISFSISLFNDLFRKKEMNKKTIIKRYLKIGIYAFIYFIISSLLEIYIIPAILKLL